MHSTHEGSLAPHRPLTEYYGPEENRRAWVLQLFQRTAGDYDRVESMMALGTGSWYRRRALLRAGLCAGLSVIDVGMGTGLVAREAARIVGDPTRVLGVDPCIGMINHSHVPEGVRMQVGSAEAIPAADSGADFLTMGYALRHISDLPAAFNEFHRVLKPGARLCILEITRPSGVLPRALLRAYMRTLVPFIARFVARDREMPTLMRYYWDTIDACASPQAIQSALREAGFTDVRRRSELGIFSEYCATRPAQAG